MSPRCNWVSGRIGMSVAVAPRVILRRNTPRAAGTLRQLGQRLSVDVLAGHVDIDAFDRHRQQFAIVDFLGAGADQVHQHLAPAGHRDDVSRLDHGIGRRIHDLAAAPDALDEHPLVGKQRLGFVRRLADDRPALPDAERAQLELVPGRAGTAELPSCRRASPRSACTRPRDRCRAAPGRSAPERSRSRPCRKCR